MDADDYLPVEESMDIAMDDLVSQMVYALIRNKSSNLLNPDDEYQDSPGKRLETSFNLFLRYPIFW